MAFSSTLNPISGKRERLSVSSTAVGFTSSKYVIAVTNAHGDEVSRKLAGGAMIQVSGADGIYWTVDGSTPDANTGFAAAAGDIIYLDSAQKIKEFKAVRSGTDTSLEAVFLFGN